VPNQSSRLQLAAFCAICLTTVSGVVAGSLVQLSYAVPLLALSMIVWAVVGKLLSGWRAVITGLTALLAAFAGLIGAYLPALLLTILASITLMRFEITRAPEHDLDTPI
jgi:hypothetical protein